MGFAAKKIVVPVDFSGESKPALQAAAELSPEAEIHVIHVLFPLERITGRFAGDISDKSRVDEVRERLDELTSIARISVAEVLIGTPGLEIADYATKIAADLIVIPSHGYHGVKRMVLGSVAERVIRHAACSVLVLRRSDAE